MTLDDRLPHAEVPAQVQLALYRIVQESLTNVARHASGARQVDVLLERTDGAYRVEIRDDGSGADGSASESGGRGVLGMRERAELLGGHLSAGPAAGGGFVVSGEIPVGTVRDMIRVALADDQQLIRGGFRSLLEAEPDLEVVGEAGTGREAVALVTETRPDVVLMDIRMPDGDGLWATEQIVADPALDGTHVVVVTTFELDEYVAQAIRAGASGFLVKDTEPVELIRAVRVVAGGEALLSPRVTKRLLERVAGTLRDAPDDARLSTLTDREREVLALVGQGLTNQEIGTALFLSPLTAKTHVSRIMSKLLARDRVQLVVVAYETGLVAPGRHGVVRAAPTALTGVRGSIRPADSPMSRRRRVWSQRVPPEPLTEKDNRVHLTRLGRRSRAPLRARLRLALLPDPAVLDPRVRADLRSRRPPLAPQRLGRRLRPRLRPLGSPGTVGAGRRGPQRRVLARRALRAG